MLLETTLDAVLVLSPTINHGHAHAVGGNRMPLLVLSGDYIRVRPCGNERKQKFDNNYLYIARIKTITLQLTL